MSFDIDRLEDGYRVLLRPPLVPEELSLSGLSRVDAEGELRSRGVHLRDIVEFIDFADQYFASGTASRRSAVRAAMYRARGATASNEDLDLLRSEIESPLLQLRRAVLIAALYAAGFHAEALQRMVALLRETREWDEQHAALSFLREWDSGVFSVEARPFILRQDGWFHGMGTQEGALLYAGMILARGECPTLLDDVASVALGADTAANVRAGARRALAEAYGFAQGSPEWSAAGIGASDDQIVQLVEAIRERLNLNGA